MLDQAAITAAAHALDQAEKTRTQIDQLSLRHPGMEIADSYAIQRAWMKLRLAEGRRIAGRKIGLTSRAMQISSNITEPDHGVLLDDMVFPQGADLPTERFIEPRVEVELAFILGRDLKGPDCSIFDVLAATDYVTPAIEIIDARIRRIDPATGATRKVFDTIADNAADAGIILGGRPVKPMEVDLRWVGALLLRNGVIEETGVAAGVLNHPANGIAWLANRLAAYDEHLHAGQIVLAGSFTRPVFAERGDTFHADYGPLGGIGFRFG